jgi:CDP-4-dehydro-6-deoxyglucose reductase, E3
MSIPEKFAEWKGILRQEIDWHPSIDEDRCTGCGMCITSCGREVFDYDVQNKKSIVANPFQCMVGWTSCRTWCIFDAISFPDPQYVKDLIREKKILLLAKHQLEEKYLKNIMEVI